MKFTVQRTLIERVNAQAVGVFIFEEKELFRRQTAALREMIGPAASPLESGFFTGKPQQVLPLYPADHRVLILVGAGKQSQCTAEKIRRSAALAAKTARSLRASTLALLEPDPEILSSSPLGQDGRLWETTGAAIAEGVILGLYRFDRYITKHADAEPDITRVQIVTPSASRLRLLKRGLEYGRVVSESTCLARDLANAPANEITPASLARKAAEVGRANRIRVRILTEQKIRALGMGGLIGVSQGSARPPRFVVMEMNRNSRRSTVVLVGKGVTFDSGGISIKPSAGMAEMKMDMSGAAAVIGTFAAAAKLKLPCRLVGLIPCTENLPSGTALKPGDILRHINGKTSEVDNTDAEGRLILADALGYADRYKPDLVIDLATLTGACVVALGHAAAGMLGNDEPTMAQLREAGDRTYERVWQLPMFEEYEKLIKSDVADVKNVGGRWAGAITGAMFLKNFIGTYKWVHLDIAGTAMLEEATDYTAKGGSGFGVRLLIDFLNHLKKTPG